MSIGVNDFELPPHSLGSPAARYELTLFDLERWCQVGASPFSKCFSGTGWSKRSVGARQDKTGRL